MKTYNSLSEEFSFLQEKLGLMCKLNTLGIAKSKAHYFPKITFESGYSMGGVTEIFCNEIFLQRIDETMEYAKSCHYHANHGYCRVELKKSQLKEIVRIFEECQNCKNDKYNEKVELIKTILNSSIKKVRVKKGWEGYFLLSDNF